VITIEAAAAIRAGEVVVIPTDTVYGLAGDPSNPGRSSASTPSREASAARIEPAGLRHLPARRPGGDDGVARSLAPPSGRALSLICRWEPAARHPALRDDPDGSGPRPRPAPAPARRDRSGRLHQRQPPRYASRGHRAEPRRRWGRVSGVIDAVPAPGWPRLSSTRRRGLRACCGRGRSRGSPSARTSEAEPVPMRRQGRDETAEAPAAAALPRGRPAPSPTSRTCAPPTRWSPVSCTTSSAARRRRSS